MSATERFNNMHKTHAQTLENQTIRNQKSFQAKEDARAYNKIRLMNYFHII